MFKEYFWGGISLGTSNKICPECGRKMKQQFIGLQHCKCGMSWKKDIGFFERTSDMAFTLKKCKTASGNIRHMPDIHCK